jgi:hypothetical protein
MPPHALNAAPRTSGGPAAALLDPERVWDEISAAEEMLYLGHADAAAILAGAALEAALRLREDAAGVPVDQLVAALPIARRDRARAERAISARDRLIRGYAEQPDEGRTREVAALAARLLSEAAPAG